MFQWPKSIEHKTYGELTKSERRRYYRAWTRWTKSEGREVHKAPARKQAGASTVDWEAECLAAQEKVLDQRQLITEMQESATKMVERCRKLERQIAALTEISAFLLSKL